MARPEAPAPPRPMLPLHRRALNRRAAFRMGVLSELCEGKPAPEPADGPGGLSEGLFSIVEGLSTEARQDMAKHKCADRTSEIRTCPVSTGGRDETCPLSTGGRGRGSHEVAPDVVGAERPREAGEAHARAAHASPARAARAGRARRAEPRVRARRQQRDAERVRLRGALRCTG